MSKAVKSLMMKDLSDQLQGVSEVVFVDISKLDGVSNNRLRIASGPEEMWRSSSPVGGGEYLRLEVPPATVRSGAPRFYNMEPTPLAVDLDGDGAEEVVVPQNQIPGMLAVVFRGPAGVRFQQVNSGFEGMITGLGAIRGEDNEPPTLLACVVHFTGLFKSAGESQIIMTAQE